MMRLAIAALAVALAPAQADPAPRPNIVFILADDMGWKDVGFHGSEIRTPHLDRLAAAGVRLEQFYVQPVCTPTRASLMTGRYPMRYGLQVGVIRPNAAYGLPLEERMLPQALREAGYATSMVGKWHLGSFDEKYWPTSRGFEHHYGHLFGMIDYNTHLRDGKLDWYRDGKPLAEKGYSTELLGKEAVRIVREHDFAKPLFLYVAFNATHSPLQAPAGYVDRYPEIADRDRRLKAAMTTCMDDQVGAIAAELEKRGVRERTLLVFASDNGGPTGKGNAADNGPLRAGKATLYEGGVRVPAFAVWPGRIKPGSAVKEMLHMVDWHPTLLRLAGAPVAQKRPLDGREAWAAIAEGGPSPRDEILHNLEPARGALRKGPWKIVVVGKLPAGDADAPRKVELFNIAEDPGEKIDLSAKSPENVKELFEILNALAREAVPPKNRE
ncbi:MAG TPA: arylsulfatase [Planctomycetota bacterium]|nr:arylsulfatase [Planctomycetota bacterium]